MKFVKLPIFVCLLLLFVACDSNSDLARVELKVTETQEQIISSDNTFGVNLFKALHSESPQENIFISPLSISYALGMTLNGAEGNTKTEMMQVLDKANLSLEEINQSYKDLANALTSLDPDVAMEIANSIWYRDNFDVLETFKTVNRDYFNAEVEALDFGDPGAKDTINNWVSDKTYGKIEEIIETIRSDHVMFLINAIYFNGAWTRPFDPELTQNIGFTSGSGTSSLVPAMYQFGEVKYADFEGFEAIELPYADKHFSMVVMLPDEDSSVNALLADLSPDKLKSSYDALEAEEIFLWLPRFELEYKAKLKDILIGLGMRDAFTSSADLSKINPEISMMINQVVHKTFVKVNEDGTEAAAVTVVDIVETSLPPNPMFRVDRPFVFLIKDNVANTILFLGKVSEL